MDRETAHTDIDFIRDVLQRTQARIDTHSFHSVHWGAIVLIWYPAANYFCSRERYDVSTALTIGCVIVGALFSTVREIMMSKRPRLEGGNTFIQDQVKLIVAFCVGAGIFFSIFGPLLDLVPSAGISIVWGFAYAVMAFMLGVVYTREYLYAGIAIFTGAVLAMLFPLYMGYILGPFMGLGMMVPGLMGERRVRKLVDGHV